MENPVSGTPKPPKSSQYTAVTTKTVVNNKLVAKEFVPKPLINAKGLNNSSDHSKHESYLSSTQHVSKGSYMGHEDGKQFLNSTLNGSAYNSNNGLDSRNDQTHKRYTQGNTQQTVIH